MKIVYTQISRIETKNLLAALDFMIDTAMDCQEKLLKNHY